MEFECVGWIKLAQDKIQWRVFFVKMATFEFQKKVV
jgi:hypothetical protein